jgi:hypothetical protein
VNRCDESRRWCLLTLRKEVGSHHISFRLDLSVYSMLKTTTLLCKSSFFYLDFCLTGGDGYGTFSDDDIAGLRSEASQREVLNKPSSAM